MITTFRTTTSGLTAQPSTEKLVVRSSSAADTSHTLTASGTVASVADSDAFTLIGKREVLATKTFTALMSATLSASCVGTVSVLGVGTPAEGSIVVTTNPANNDTVTLGLTGFTQTYTFKTVLTGAANEVFIGATEALTATNLKKAINDEGTEATHYGTGTVANAYCTATVSTATLTLLDKISCKRQLGWSLAQSAAGLTLTVPSGGIDGTTLATLVAGVTQKSGIIALDDEALALGLIPPLYTWTSDWIQVGGKTCTLYLACSNVTTGLTVTYQVATNTAYPVAGSTNLTALDNNRYAVSPAENGIEYLRATIVNSNSAAVSVNAKVVSGR